jgi:hypothetical protein
MTPSVSKVEQSVVIDVKLEPGAFAGLVLRPDGRPAANAQVAIASHTNEVTVSAGALTYTGHGKTLRTAVTTDALGRFELPAEIDPSVLVAGHESGFGEITTVPPRKASRETKPADASPLNNQALRVALRPWGRVEGRVVANGKPLVGATYWVHQSRSDDVLVWLHQHVVSDVDGRFVIERIPAGPYGQCQRYAANRDGNGSHAINGMIARFDIPPGKTTTILLGNPGGPSSASSPRPMAFHTRSIGPR